MHPLLNVISSFAAGAAAMYWLDSAVTRRHRGTVVSEPRLGEQVQARIGKLVSHPDAIKVSVEGGLVRVSGLVLAGEMDRLLMHLTQLPGVHKVHNALSPVDDPQRFDERREAEQAQLQPAGAVI